MEVRAGYKQAEICFIPQTWDVKSVSTVSVVIDSLHVTPTFSSDGYSMVRVADIKTGKLNLDNALKVSKDVYENFTKKYTPKKGNLVLSRVGSYGVSSYVDTDELFCMGQNTVVINSKIPPLYLYHALNSSYVNNQIEIGSFGSGYKSLSLKNINDLKIALPPSPLEQESIANALSDADSLIESLEKLIEKKRQIKQGAMQELLTCKKRLAGFSGEWQTKSLGKLFVFSGGYTASRDQLSHDGYCYLHYGDIHSSESTFINVDSNYAEIPKLSIPLSKVSVSSLLDDGDVVFVDASEDDEGTSRHVVVINPNKIPYISGLHTIVAKRKSNEINPLFLRYCFQTLEIKSQFRFYAVGTKVSGISKANIAKINIKFPIEAEQLEIAHILSDMDSELTQLEQKLTKTRLIKQGMMQELLTGKIRLV